MSEGEQVHRPRFAVAAWASSQNERHAAPSGPFWGPIRQLASSTSQRSATALSQPGTPGTWIAAA